MTPKMFQARQGDVLINQIPSFDTTDQPKAPVSGKSLVLKKGYYSLARGQSGQHEHIVSAADAELYLPKDSYPVLVVKQATKLVVVPDGARHPEIEIPPGFHEVRGQQEFIRERPRPVVD